VYRVDWQDQRDKSFPRPMGGEGLRWQEEAFIWKDQMT
jgi:hypothetical protein